MATAGHGIQPELTCNWQLASSLLTAVVGIIASRPRVASAYTIELISIAGWSLVLRPYNAPGAVNLPPSPSPATTLVFVRSQADERAVVCLSACPSSKFQVRLTDCLVGWLVGWLVAGLLHLPSSCSLLISLLPLLLLLLCCQQAKKYVDNPMQQHQQKSNNNSTTTTATCIAVNSRVQQCKLKSSLQFVVFLVVATS